MCGGLLSVSGFDCLTALSAMDSSSGVERSTLPTAVVHGAGKKLGDPGAADENGGYQ